MRSTELFRSCSNEHVAAAAIACIGGALEKRVAAAARGAGLSHGAFVVRLLTDYDRMASPKRRTALEQGMSRGDMPILAGLRHVVETALEGAWDKVGATREGADDELDPAAFPWSGGAALLRDGAVLKVLHS